MPIPGSIKPQHIESACSSIASGQHVVPSNRRSTKHCLVVRDCHFAPKFIVSLAGKFANGAPWPAGEFNGGPETNGFIKQLGFQIVECHCGGLGNAVRFSHAKNKQIERVENHKIVRLICKGRPPQSAKKARQVLTHAFVDLWPKNIKAKITLTPGGFISMPFPKDWAGRSGWKSRDADITPLQCRAEKMLKSILDESLLARAVNRTDVLTVGFDFFDESDGINGLHAELIAIVNLKTRDISWTGKSYPTLDQEDKLVHVTSVKSHFVTIEDERILVLGCHDLNAFSNRSRPKKGSARFVRQQEMRERSRKFRPTVVLHHPHSTDSDRIWQVAWYGVRQHIWDGKIGSNTYASGIAWFRHGAKCRGKLVRVLNTTKMGDIIDIIIKKPS